MSSLAAQSVKILPAMCETWVASRGQEDPLEEEMEPHSSILTWRIPWTEEPGGLQSMGSHRVGHDRVTNTYSLDMMCLTHWWTSGFLTHGCVLSLKWSEGF